jgi:glycosyltransferase involved in cell wall biosynthesis
LKILFLSHYFPPEVNAPASRTFDHCRAWVRAGHDVTVVTCVPNCPDGVVFEGYRNRLRVQEENIEGIRVVRIWTFVAANAGTFWRMVNYVSYMISATVNAIRLPRPDIVVATSPQFFCGWAGVFVASLKRAPFVLEIRDIWPESITAAEGLKRGRSLLGMVQRLADWMYLSADHIVAVGDGYRAKILERVAIPERVSVITNGVDLSFFAGGARDSAFLRQWGLCGKFVCSYVGTVGMAHRLDVVLRAARLLRERGRSDIVFLIVGDGAERRKLEAAARATGVEDLVVFTGRLPKEMMPTILASSDACLVHLRKCETFTTVLPSKIFETMAMSRPIIMGVEGQARDIVMAARAGVAMEPESETSLVAAVEKMADEPQTVSQLGRAARAYVAQHYDRNVLAARYVMLLERVAKARMKTALASESPATGAK